MALCFVLPSLSAAANLEEVVVTGSRNLLAQPLMAHLGDQSVGAEEQVSLDRTIGDWLNTLPGASINGQGGLMQSYSLRGMSRSRIRTEVDGIPILTDRAAGSSAAFLPPFLVENVRSTVGPASALYGSDAMGGVVGITSRSFKRPVIQLALHNNDNARHLAAGAPVGDSGSIGLVLRRASLAEAADGQPLNSGYQQSTLAFRHQGDWNEVTARVSALLSRGSDIGKSSRNYPDQQTTIYPHDRHGALKVELERDGQWLMRFYYHDQDWRSATLNVDASLAENDYRAASVGSLFYVSSRALGGLGRMGVEWLGRRDVEIDYRDWNHVGQLMVESTPVSGEQDTLGLFADHQWTLGAWAVGAGIRVDHVAQRDAKGRQSQSAPSADMRLQWRMHPDWKAFASLGTGFRFPTLTELYYQGVTPRGAVVGNPALKAERNRSVEVGLSGLLGGANLTITGYQTDFRDFIERYEMGPEVLSYRNIAEGKIKGYEVAWDYRPSSAWRHVITYSDQTGENVATGDWLADLNPPRWRYFGAYRYNDLVLSVDVSHRPDREDFGPGEAPLDAVSVVNLAASWRLDGHWEWGLACTNCGNRQFFATADALAPLQPGRTLSLRLTWMP